MSQDILAHNGSIIKLPEVRGNSLMGTHKFSGFLPVQPTTISNSNFTAVVEVTRQHSLGQTAL